MTTLLLLLAMQVDVAAELAKINARLAVIEAQLGIGGQARLEVLGVSAGAVTVGWSGVVSPAARDWIGVFVPGAAATAYRAWVYAGTCTTSVGPVPGSAGQCGVGGLAPGTYDARYFRNDSSGLVASTGVFTIGSVVTGHEGHVHRFGVPADEVVCQTGSEVTVQWDAPTTGADGYELLVASPFEAFVEVGNALWVRYVWGSGTRCVTVRAVLRG